MKNKLINMSPARFARSGVVAGAAVACGYWISQILATNFVSGAFMNTSSVIAGALLFVPFAILFVLHLFKPLSKTAAMLGLGSFCVFTAAMAYQCEPGLPHYLSLVRYAFSVSTVLGLAGVVVDANRCRRVFRTHGQRQNSPEDFVI